MSDEQPPQPDQDPDQAVPGSSSTTVLVVEDEPFVRELLRRMLGRHGYQVLAAANPAEALAVLAGHERVALMVTDVVMPQMSGGELAARATTRQAGLGVLYMSGYRRDVAVARGLIEEGTPILQKPFTERALVDAVRELVGGTPG